MSVVLGIFFFSFQRLVHLAQVDHVGWLVIALEEVSQEDFGFPDDQRISVDAVIIFFQAILHCRTNMSTL